MKNKIDCNFDAVFAGISDANDLKSVANEIREQLISAFNTRKGELDKASKKVTVKIAADNKKGAKEQPAPKAKKTAKDKTEKKTKTAATKEPAADIKTKIVITDMAAIKKLGLTFKKYNDKCWVLRGDTKPLKDILKDKFKGVFNSRLTGGEGWVIRTAMAQDCADALGFNIKVA